MARNQGTAVWEGFKGLNNKEDRWSLDNTWFEQLDDWDVDDAGGLRVRPGYSQVTTGIADGFSCEDGSAAFLIRSSDNALLRFNEDETVAVIRADVGAGPYYWAELGRNVYLNGAESSWEIRPDGVYEWGLPAPAQPSALAAANTGTLPAGVYQIAATFLRADGFESGASPPIRATLSSAGALHLSNVPLRAGCETLIYVSPPDGDRFYLAARTTTALGITLDGDPAAWVYPLSTLHLRPPPLGKPTAAFDGRLWVAVTDNIHGFTRLFYSEQLRPGYFIYDPSNPVDIPDAVVTAVGTPQGILVGGERALYAVTVSEDGLYRTQTLALYGAKPTAYDRDEDGRAYIWTTRGLVRAFPFENVTEQRLRVDAGLSAACLVRNLGGYQTLLVSPRGSTNVFNPYGTRITPTIHTHGLLLPSESGFLLLLESGDALLLESGDNLLLE